MYNSGVGVRNRCKPFKSVSCPERAFYLTKIDFSPRCRFKRFFASTNRQFVGLIDGRDWG
jgi:hypothetical protein